MTKLYTITDLKNHPVSCGNAGKTSWKSSRWINYHLARRYRSRSLEHFLVHTIDLSQGIVTKISASAFIQSLPQNVEKTKTEIAARFGFAIDLSSLEILFRNNALNPNIVDDVRQYLLAKGIR